MNLGNKIIKLRKKARFSQEILANKIGVSRQTISNWELNITIPDANHIKKLSNIFDISIDALLDNDIRDIIERRVSNTEKLTNKNFKNIKILLVTLYFVILTGLLYIIIYYSTNKDFTNKYQNVYTCILNEKNNIHDIDTGTYLLYWNWLDDETFSVVIELDDYDDNTIYNEFDKGIYGYPIYAKMNAGKSIVAAVESLEYFKNLLIYHGATCK